MDVTGSLFDPARSLEDRRQAAVNLFDFLVRGGMADVRRTPSDVIDDAPQCTVLRYRPDDDRGIDGPPVLLVPPLGAPATCMDLRRGCSLAEHMVQSGRPTYLVDYGPVGFGERGLGLEHWISTVVPAAVRAVSRDSGGQPVQLVGWCMGGIFSLLATAADPTLPIAAVAMIASPFDFTKVSLGDPLRDIGKVTGGNVLGAAVRLLGGTPAWLTSAGFKATAVSTYLKKPITLLRRRDDREFLAHIQVVDELMDSMYAYPGRAMGQAYHRLFHRNELAGGRFALPKRMIELSDVRVPVLSIAGLADVIAPVAAAHHVGELLTNAPRVLLETASGGHLGVLTGLSASTTTWEHLDGFLGGPADG